MSAKTLLSEYTIFIKTDFNILSTIQQTTKNYIKIKLLIHRIKFCALRRPASAVSAWHYEKPFSEIGIVEYIRLGLFF